MLLCDLYLSHFQRERNIRQLKLFSDIFKSRVYPLFSNIDNEANEYGKKQYNDIIIRKPCGYDDECTVAEQTQEKETEYYLMLCDVRYQILASFLVSLYQIWEQQLIYFVNEECAKERIDKKFGYSTQIHLYKNNKIEIKLNPKINRLRALVNVIKHGDGKAGNNLRKLYPQYCTNDFGIDTLGLYKNSLLDRSLVIEDKDFNMYKDVLIKFWKSLPERSKVTV
jgi:hypothetical protein